MRFRLGKMALMLVLFVWLCPITKAQGALPSQVLAFRDGGEHLTIGLGFARDAIGISSSGGVSLQTGEGEYLVEAAKSVQIARGITPPMTPVQETMWRVQVLATGDGVAAARLSKDLQAAHGLRTHIVYTEPWFKLQVGNEPTLERAEALRQKLLELGYEGAWVVKGGGPGPEAAAATPYPPSEQLPKAGLPPSKGFIIREDTGKVIAYVNCGELVAEPVGGTALTLAITGAAEHTYRGQLRLLAGESEIVQMLNVINIEDYLCGVVGSELYSNAPADQAALGAQAIAARTYALRNLGKHEDEGFDLCTTTHCQVYQGVERESDVIRTAVEMTKGEILVYAGEAISAVYHSSSGGATAAAEEVWATKYSGYLRPVIDEIIDPETQTTIKLGQDRPGFNWEVDWNAGELDGILRRHLAGELGAKVSPTAVLKDLRVERQTGDRVHQLSIIYADPSGSADQRERVYSVNKDKIRWVLRKPDQQILPSTNFALQVETSDGRLIKAKAMGQGNGHGVGLAQTGALHMARLGYGHEEILTHYYTDVMVMGLPQYYKEMESKLIWEQNGLVETWATILGPRQGIEGPAEVFQLSPGGDQVAYSLTGEGGGVWVFNTINGQRTMLLDASALEIAWKADSLALAVVATDADGGRQLKILSLPRQAVDPGAPSQGKLLAQGPDIHDINWLPGTDLVLFSQNGMIYCGQGEPEGESGISIPLFTESTVPASAPSGREIAFWRNDAIWLYHLSTGTFHRVCPMVDVWSLAWSPNGKYLAVETEAKIKVLDLDTATVSWELVGGGPSWSADGRLLAYVENSSGGLADMYIAEMGSEGKGVLVSPGQKGGAIRWSARGKTLAHNADGRLHLLTWR